MKINDISILKNLHTCHSAGVYLYFTFFFTAPALPAPLCPACPVAPEDGTGVKFFAVTV